MENEERDIARLGWYLERLLQAVTEDARRKDELLAGLLREVRESREKFVETMSDMRAERRSRNGKDETGVTDLVHRDGTYVKLESLFDVAKKVWWLLPAGAVGACTHYLSEFLRNQK